MTVPYSSAGKLTPKRVQLFGAIAIAYNLGNLWRRLALPTGIDTWSLTSLQQRLMKTVAVS